jgi:hypothetical protein
MHIRNYSCTITRRASIENIHDNLRNKNWFINNGKNSFEKLRMAKQNYDRVKERKTQLGERCQNFKR